MTVALHWIYAVIHFGVSLWNREIFRRQGHPLILGLLLTTIALVYDNFILGIGSWIGIGDLLATLSVFRFVFHALLTPSLLWTGLYIVLGATRPPHQNSTATTTRKSTLLHRITALSVIVLTIVGIQENLLEYRAYPVCQRDGLIRYTQNDPASLHPELLCGDFRYNFHPPSSSTTASTVATPATTTTTPPTGAANLPWAPIATVLILLGMGAHVAVATKGSACWLFLGSLFMCILSAAGSMTTTTTTTTTNSSSSSRTSSSSPPSLWLGNAGEVILVTCMSLALHLQQQHQTMMATLSPSPNNNKVIANMPPAKEA